MLCVANVRARLFRFTSQATRCVYAHMYGYVVYPLGAYNLGICHQNSCPGLDAHRTSVPKTVGGQVGKLELGTERRTRRPQGIVDPGESRVIQELVEVSDIRRRPAAGAVKNE
jgi:hypothetical protein